MYNRYESGSEVRISEEIDCLQEVPQHGNESVPQTA